ncbi:TolC family protein [soil metagenome]
MPVLVIFLVLDMDGMKQKFNFILVIALVLALSQSAGAQTGLPDTTGKSYTLAECISIALDNQPAVRQAQLDEEITDRQIKASLSGWFPQINAAANYNRNLELPVSFFPNQTTGERTAVRIGVFNTSNFLIEARQSIFNNELFLASRNAKPLRRLFSQNTEEVRISSVVAVSKAYYDILISQEQLSILDQVRQRQERQLNDARNLYEGGLVDPTDYKRATIALNNTLADIKRTIETLKYKYAYLHQLMGTGTSDVFAVKIDKQSLEADMLLDTTQLVDFNNRIELQQLETQRQLQGFAISAQKWSLFPTLSAFANRNHVFQNDEFSQLYKTMYPNSVVGVSLVLPIFQGGRRYHNWQQEKLINQRIDEDIRNTQNVINTQYQQSMALYKSDLNDYKTATANVQLSEEVYNTIKLQYDEGIRTYLDLMIAESDLRSAQINQLNTMLHVLSSKLDVLQSLGIINTNQ